MKLSKQQEYAINGMSKNGWPSTAFELQVGLNTMDALRSRGLVRCINHGVLGSQYSPRTTLEWVLIDKEDK